VASYENAVYQWRRAERRLLAASPERRPMLDRIVNELVAELRRRLGGRFTAQELADLYANGTSWCMQTAMVAAPDDPWAWDSSLVADAAFGRYLREASDYAGGRLALSEA
jgi:hypothetical protein